MTGLYGIIWAISIYWNEKNTPDEAARWDFGNFLVPFGITKIIVVDADGLFAGMFKNTF